MEYGQKENSGNLVKSINPFTRVIMRIIIGIAVFFALGVSIILYLDFMHFSEVAFSVLLTHISLLVVFMIAIFIPIKKHGLKNLR